ncbi:MAG: O-antigen ligase domain-containing protein [Hyphomicrobiales bacterium]|nr:MAG: O-antigen ligase domain-containing protein [Hyphomicrobiales bacterium]
MGPTNLQPQTLEERIVYWAIVCTWGVWLLGGLYILAPVLGWVLATIAVARHLTNASPRAQRALGCDVWLVSAGIMAIGLIVGHCDFDLGFDQTLKSFIGWMKGWALMALFMYVGAKLSIRPHILYRATNILGAQTLVLVPIFVAAALLRVPATLYVSPLEIVGGPGPEFFNVELYGISPDGGGARWRFFAPWAPAAAFIASIAIVFASYDKRFLWKATGIVSALAVCVMSQSRLALIAVPFVALMIVTLANLKRPMVFALGMLVCLAVLPFASELMSFADDTIAQFHNARAASSRVRSILQSIALHRWWNEAPIWGHGIVEKGPHLVEFMKIGSHHTWNGLLYIKGIVGFAALALPLAWSVLEMIAKAQADRVARLALGVLLTLLFFSFGENLEILIYLFWPGMIVVGIASRRRFVQPYHAFMSGRRLQPTGIVAALPAQ